MQGFLKGGREHQKEKKTSKYKVNKHLNNRDDVALQISGPCLYNTK